MTEDKLEKRKRGRTPNTVATSQYSVHLEKETAEWAKGQPGGLSGFLRELLIDAFLFRPREGEDNGSEEAVAVAKYPQQLTQDEMEFLAVLRELPPEALGHLIQAFLVFAEDARQAQRWRRDAIEAFQRESRSSKWINPELQKSKEFIRQQWLRKNEGNSGSTSSEEET